MKTSELIKTLQKSLKDYGDVEVVINKHYYTKVTEVIPIFKQESLGLTDMVVSKVEIY